MASTKWIPQAGQDKGNDPMSIWEEVEQPNKQSAPDQGKDGQQAKPPAGNEPKKSG